MITLTTVQQRATFVHTSDPDVVVPDSLRGRALWVPVGDCTEVKPGATRVEVRPLAGPEMLSAWGNRDPGERSIAVVELGVVALDGQAPDRAVMRTWAWDVLGGLEQVIEQLSRGPTAARR